MGFQYPRGSCISPLPSLHPSPQHQYLVTGPSIIHQSFLLFTLNIYSVHSSSFLFCFIFTYSPVEGCLGCFSSLGPQETELLGGYLYKSHCSRVCAWEWTCRVMGQIDAQLYQTLLVLQPGAYVRNAFPAHISFLSRRSIFYFHPALVIRIMTTWPSSDLFHLALFLLDSPFC